MLPSRSYLAFCLFLSTLSLRRATAGNGGSGSITAISIHALLAESDVLPSYYTSRDYIFLSTLSLRRATGNPARRPIGRRHFYPRSPCGERLKLFAKRLGNALISIHALLAESDQMLFRQSTQKAISIHALLAESDDMKMRVICTSVNFYPRSPCGERPIADRYNMGIIRISIHALLAESDWVLTGGLSFDGNFYPRSPCGERQLQQQQLCCYKRISIHALLAESDE